MKKVKTILTVALIAGCMNGKLCSAQVNNIKVVRAEADSDVVIYTGPPGGYSNGSFSSLDFDNNDFYVILDWETDEVLYIYPMNTQQTEIQNDILDTLTKTEHIENIQISGTDSTGVDTVSVSINESISTQGFEAEYTIQNTGENEKTLKLIGAIYSNGCLVDAVTRTVSVQGDRECEEILVLASEKNAADSAKFFAWDSSMKPLCDCVEILRPSESEENEIFENEVKQLIPGVSYLFCPKRSGVYSFSCDENLKLYKKAFGVLTEADKNSMLFYPADYYLEVDEVSDIEIEYSGNKTNGQAFLTGDYYSEMSDSGSLYKGNTKVYASLTRWLSVGNNLYLNSDGLKKYDESTNETINLLPYANPYYIVTDGDIVYFADMNKGGVICKYQNGEQSIVCNDKAAWLSVEGDCIYYKNLLDGGREYRIEKNSENAPCGSLAE